MNVDQGVRIFAIMLMLILPLSALLSRRVPLRQGVKMAAIWIAIFLVAMLAIGLVRSGGASWSQIGSLLSDDEQNVAGGTVRLRKAEDGHFWATVTINGIDRRMLIDSGATTTSLSLATARAASLNLDQNSIPTMITTANGTVMARTSSIDRLVIGPITARDLRVVVAPEFGDVDLLGMNFLSRLKSWHVDGDTLVLEPKA